MTRRQRLPEHRRLLPAGCLLAALLSALVAWPAAAPAHYAPMANLPPIQLPDHADPPLPEEDLWQVATPEERSMMMALPNCRTAPPDSVVCVESCPDGGGPVCGVQIQDPQAVVAQRLAEVANPPRCEPDPHIHVVYAYPRNRPDATASVIPQINTILNRANARLYRDGRESSGGWVPAEYRVGCTPAGEIIVHTVHLPNIDAADVGDPNTLYWRVVHDVQAAGHTSADDKYLVYADVAHPTACGQAAIRDDSRKTPENLNNDAAPDYAVVYAGVSGCFNSSVTMHELGHVMGAVQLDAPNSTRRHHCSAVPGADIMCYADGSPDQHSSPDRCSLTGPYERFDCSFNNYFDTREEPSWSEPYLDDHWNVGGPENRFLWRGY